MSSIADAVHQRFLDEVSSWNWERAVHEAQTDHHYDPESGSHMGRVFLGTTSSLMPSGKFYTPWANSNVTECPHCHGLGHVKNLNANPVLQEEARSEANKMRREMMTKYGPWFGGNWPAHQQEAIKALDLRAKLAESHLQCPFCCGWGSEEAFHDSLMQEVLEKVAEEHGGFIDYSDSDIFFAMVVDVEEDEDAE